MTDKLFDDFFKQKLEHYDSGAPMHVWEKVRRELHEDDDDKGIIWWRKPLGLLTLSLLLGGIFIYTIIVVNEKWLTSSKSVSQSINKDFTTSKETNKNFNSSPVNKSDDIISKNEYNLSDNKALLNKNNDAKPSEKDQTRSLNNPLVYNSTNTKSVLSNKQSHKLFLTYRNKRVKKVSYPLFKQEQNDIKDINPATHTFYNNNDNPADINLSMAFSNGWKKTNLSSFRPLNTKALTTVNLKCLSNCPTIGPPPRNDLYIEVYGSADNVTRSLSGTSYTPTNYINKRKEAEKSQVGFSAGIRVAKNLNERVLLKAGVNYSQINETFKYINENDIRIITVITIRTVTSGGQTITIRDTTQVTQIGTSYTTYYNKYRTLDIPIILSYELGNNKSFSAGINVGAIINITSSYKGHILDTNLSPVPVNTNSTLGVNAWRKNIGLGLYASISFYKRINDQIQLFFEPYTRINLNPVNTNKLVVKQKYNTTGLQIGVRYNLFHKRQRYIE
ncbi:MAG TPA: outer membrane beta-barrel protein [Chitinophagaceae bacterium]|nr:outer membrane beta-barrel protein [Chitinophagaceae bacterium]